jgi:hypothetical protein
VKIQKNLLLLQNIFKFYWILILIRNGIGKDCRSERGFEMNQDRSRLIFLSKIEGNSDGTELSLIVYLLDDIRIRFPLINGIVEKHVGISPYDCGNWVPDNLKTLERKYKEKNK